MSRRVTGDDITAAFARKLNAQEELHRAALSYSRVLRRAEQQGMSGAEIRAALEAAASR
mgnify:CR=1 FL=1